MPFNSFGYPQVIGDLGLTLHTADLFGDVPPLPVSDEFRRRLAQDVTLAVNIATEKARSEFIIAPVLAELRRLLPRRFSLFSGVELNVDPPRGLVGVCDFLVSRSENQSFVEAPILAVAEAKNDSTRLGLGQCIAETVAARLLNERTGRPVAAVFGVSTTGTAWKFLRLTGTTVTLDEAEHLIDDPGRIMGILRHVIETG
jgi:hypothetical protein